MTHPPIDFEKLAEAVLTQGGRRVGVGETVVLSPSLQFTVLSGSAVVGLDGQLRVATGDILISRNAKTLTEQEEAEAKASVTHENVRTAEKLVMVASEEPS